ncbi:PTS sugar transporter subunit IIA [Clostridium sp.]
MYLLIVIATKGEEHLEILSNIAQALGDVEAIENLKTTKNSQDVLKVFNL